MKSSWDDANSLQNIAVLAWVRIGAQTPPPPPPPPPPPHALCASTLRTVVHRSSFTSHLTTENCFLQACYHENALHLWGPLWCILVYMQVLTTLMYSCLHAGTDHSDVFLFTCRYWPLWCILVYMQVLTTLMYSCLHAGTTDLKWWSSWWT